MPATDRAPLGDPARHQTLAALDAGLRACRSASPRSGRVTLLVQRLADGTRETPSCVQLDCEEGFPGDDWSRRAPRDPDAQLAVMHRDVAELIANGQPLTLFGDNLFVDIELSAAHQKPGTRFRVGGAIVETTAKPHNGCARFRQRFGPDALRFVQAAPTRELNLRGVYWRVIEPGEVRIGDSIERLAPDERAREVAIRDETAADVPLIHALTAAAFRSAPHTSHTEQFIVVALREAGALTLSLVAEAGGAVVGHVAVSPVSISDGTPGWFGLGPISVEPESQRRSVGSRLMREALRTLRERGAGGCVLLGDPAFYGRFGFRVAPGLVLPDVPPEYFQAVSFGSSQPRGTVTFHEAFQAKG